MDAEDEAGEGIGCSEDVCVGMGEAYVLLHGGA